MAASYHIRANRGNLDCLRSTGLGYLLMIDGYKFGRITVDGKDFRTDLILLPDRVLDSWWRKEGHNLCLEDLGEALAAEPEVLVIGQGEPGLMKVPETLVEELQRRGIEVSVAPTREAVRAYNGLAGKRKVVAALHLTC
jgi:hypothetical protein